MIQVRLGAAGALLAFGAHTAHVFNERSTAPVGRLLQFSPGSQDDVWADNLHSGDLILFSRDCVLYPCLEAGVCAARKELSGIKYDHAGVIVKVRGVPHVLEQTAHGVRCRRYDARIKATRSTEVVVRPLGLDLSPAQQSSLSSFLSAAANVPADGPALPYGDPRPHLAVLLSPTAGFTHIKDLAGLAVDKARNPSVDFVAEFYSRLGLHSTAGASAAGPGKPSPASATDNAGPPRLTMAQLADWQQQPLANAKFRQPIWIRQLL